nr:pro-neuregulin-4, membrane-bound isoform isoform X6 [Chrysemys picta bellii]
MCRPLYTVSLLINSSKILFAQIRVTEKYKWIDDEILDPHECKDHEELCGTSYGPFCLNGGICYMIPTVSSPFCRKVHIRRASSTERGVSLVETTRSNGCNKITE